MPPAKSSAPGAERRSVDLAAGYAAHLARSGRGNSGYTRAARSFLQCWPDPQRWAAQPLAARLGEGPQMSSFLMFLMVYGHLRPGYDYLVARKLSSFWRDVTGAPMEADMARFRRAAESIGYTPIQSLRVCSQSVGRLCIQTGRRLDELTGADFDALSAACRQREQATGEGWVHYRKALNAAHRVLFHLGVLDRPPAQGPGPKPFEDRMADVSAALRPAFVAYLERKAGRRPSQNGDRCRRRAWPISAVSWPRSTRRWRHWTNSTGAATSNRI